jgi:hypothetical protein
MSDLLLLGCSARKRTVPAQPVAAIERYDGVFYRVLRKWLRSAVQPHLDVLIVSAQFGLIESATPIPNYERRMTSRRALELASGVQAKFNSLVSKRRYRRIFVNLGRDYGITVSGVTELQNAVWAKGAIGKRARQMKRWLEESRHVGDF